MIEFLVLLLINYKEKKVFPHKNIIPSPQLFCIQISIIRILYYIKDYNTRRYLLNIVCIMHTYV